MTLRANWNYPTAVRFGAGRIAELAEVCAANGIRRPLLVTDAGLANAPITRDALERLRAWAVEAEAPVAELQHIAHERSELDLLATFATDRLVRLSAVPGVPSIDG